MLIPIIYTANNAGDPLKSLGGDFSALQLIIYYIRVLKTEKESTK